jgi:hypothetical protein
MSWYSSWVTENSKRRDNSLQIQEIVVLDILNKFNSPFVRESGTYFYDRLKVSIVYLWLLPSGGDENNLRQGAITTNVKI